MVNIYTIPFVLYDLWWFDWRTTISKFVRAARTNVIVSFIILLLAPCRPTFFGQLSISACFSFRLYYHIKVKIPKKGVFQCKKNHCLGSRFKKYPKVIPPPHSQQESPPLPGTVYLFDLQARIPKHFPFVVLHSAQKFPKYTFKFK